jgi:hypothetical protein
VEGPTIWSISRDGVECAPSAAKAGIRCSYGGTAEQAAEKLDKAAESSPQALKRERIFNVLRHE